MQLDNMTTEALQEHRKQLQAEIQRLDAMQQAKKIQLNSAYGALG